MEMNNVSRGFGSNAVQGSLAPTDILWHLPANPTSFPTGRREWFLKVGLAQWFAKIELGEYRKQGITHSTENLLAKIKATEHYIININRELQIKPVKT